MKNMFISSSLTFLLIAYGRLCGQSCVYPQTSLVYNMSTGIVDGTTNQQIPYGQPDDTWKAQRPNTSTWVDAICANLNQQYYPLAPSNMRWLSPDLSGNYLNFSVPGKFRFKMQFYVPVHCNFQSANIHFNYFYSDDVTYKIWVNQTPHTVAYGGFLLGWPMVTNANISVNSTELVPGAMNEIIIEVDNFMSINNSGSQTGMEIDGDLTITAVFLSDQFGELVDQNGNVKSEFCMDDDIFFTIGPDLNTGGSIFCDSDNDGSYESMTASWNAHYPVYNLKYLLGQYGARNYRLTGNIQTPCGTKAFIKYFKIICCGNTDATFSLKTNSAGILTGVSARKGNHSWKVYSAPNANAGPYTLLNTFNSQNFSLGSEQFCYFVKHDLTIPGCPSACAAQSFCNFNCEDKKCNLSPPVGLNYDPVTKLLSWLPVQGASHYVITININDPACCTGNPFVSPGPTSFTATGSSHVLDIAADLGIITDLSINCFSWSIYAICQDGAKSPVSESRCSNAPPSGGNPQGRSGRNENPANEDRSLLNSAKSTVLNVFPNPAIGMVTIELESTENTEFVVDIYDVTGKCIKTFSDMGNVSQKARITWNMEEKGKGLYIVKITTSNGEILTTKLIKE